MFPAPSGMLTGAVPPEGVGPAKAVAPIGFSVVDILAINGLVSNW